MNLIGVGLQRLFRVWIWGIVLWTDVALAQESLVVLAERVSDNLYACAVSEDARLFFAARKRDLRGLPKDFLQDHPEPYKAIKAILSGMNVPGCPKLFQVKSKLLNLKVVSKPGEPFATNSEKIVPALQDVIAMMIGVRIDIRVSVLERYDYVYTMPRQYGFVSYLGPLADIQVTYIPARVAEDDSEED